MGRTECVWCGATVYMSLQGFFSGGTWTTDPACEGPCNSYYSAASVACPESPDSEHSCFATEVWLEGVG